MTLIHEFARNYDLKVVANDGMFGNKMRAIQFPDETGDLKALIFDIEQEYRAAPPDWFSNGKGKKDCLANLKKNGLLGLVLFAEHDNMLYEDVGFDVPRYDNTGGS